MDDKAVRQWARQSGLPVGERGRLPSAIVEAYVEAHPDVQWERPDRKPHARCPRCSRAWAGLAQAHCMTCHLHFSTVKNFDMHRGGTGRYCRSPEELLDQMILKEQYGPYGVTWVGAEDRPEGVNAE